MEWLPPKTNDTVGLLSPDIISAIARPHSTSPPTVILILPEAHLFLHHLLPVLTEEARVHI